MKKPTVTLESLDQTVKDNFIVLDTKIGELTEKIDSMYAFLVDHVMLRQEIYDTFAQKTEVENLRNPFIDAFDQWGKKHETLDNEFAIYRYRQEQLEAKLVANGVI